MDITDILHISDLSWKGAFAPKISADTHFETTIREESITEPVLHYIQEPIFVIDTLHSCYAHAIIDQIAAYFWVTRNIPRIKVFIRSRGFIYFTHNLNLIDDTHYKGVWKSLLEIITPLSPIFEHKLDGSSHYKFKDAYIYPLDDKNQRSIWNCNEYYPGRVIQTHPRFCDADIYENLQSLRRYVLGNRTLQGKNILLIDRKVVRRFDNKLLIQLQYICSSTKYNYEEPYILEDMTFDEQVTLFSEAKVVIFRHGSSLTNLLWVPNGCIVFDIDVERDRKNIVGRLCALTDSSHHYLDYNNLDVKKDIFDKIY
jgi:hypothetical protein